MSTDENIKYVATTTGQEFHADDSFIRCVMGPVGSGKSSMMVFEMLKRSMEQPAWNGVRRSRWVVIRNTYSELKSTTIKTFEHWIGSLGTLVYDSPIRWNAKRKLDDGTTLDMEVLFLALDSVQDTKKLRSLETTSAWENESSEIPLEVLKVLRGRVGRYPSKRQGGAGWHGIIMDTNPPSVISESYQLFVEERPRGHKLFRQPGGLMKNPDYDALDENSEEYIANPLAENIGNLPGGYEYYFNQLRGSTEDYVSSMICGDWGAIYSGRAVYSNYSDTAHAAREPLKPAQNKTLVIGLDFGWNPAAAITQMQPHGALYVLDEIAPQDVSLGEFLDEFLLPLLRTKYRGYSVICCGDPTGTSRNVVTKKSTFDELKTRGLASVPAKTNDPVLRRDAVSYFLQRRSGFLLSPSCTVLKAGFAGGYHFAKIKAGQFKPTPAKTFESHAHDSLQYAAVYYRLQANPSAKKRVIGVAPKPFLFA